MILDDAAHRGLVAEVVFLRAEQMEIELVLSVIGALRRWRSESLGCWSRDPDGYTVVLARPDGSADGWKPPVFSGNLVEIKGCPRIPPPSATNEGGDCQQTTAFQVNDGRLNRRRLFQIAIAAIPFLSITWSWLFGSL